VRSGSPRTRGTGYGSRWIADQCRCSVHGVDGSRESIRFAREHFGTPKIVFAAEVFPFPLLGTYDAIVSFESLEHVVNDVTLAQVMVDALRPGGRLLLSVPNERKLPHATFRNRFHVRHYTREQVVALFPTLTLDAWFGQNVKDYERGQRLPDDDMALLPETEGQSLVFAFTKGAP
jgi:2-polyprenyl-3-methyl-5-hydroxy-6-metoxy-1,4-benzoquinol methylase